MHREIKANDTVEIDEQPWRLDRRTVSLETKIRPDEARPDPYLTAKGKRYEGDR